MKILIFYMLTILCCGLLSCNNSDSVFTDEEYQDTIKQDLGGFLIRSIHHYNDIHNWNYDIEYFYKNNFDSLIRIGVGRFYCQIPPKNEQLLKFDKWIIFYTSKDRDSDIIFISDTNLKTWTENIICPDTIQNTAYWKEQNIDSQIGGNWDNVSKIKKIDKKGNITVLFTYAIENRIFSFITGKRLIIFEVNQQTGKLEMKSILKV